MFDHIVPCGIAEHPMTSLAAEGFAVTDGRGRRRGDHRRRVGCGDRADDVAAMVTDGAAAPSATDAGVAR